MPEDAPANKLAATRGYGAEVIPFDRYTSDREELLAALVEERGAIPVHPYDDERVMAGQGTVAKELFEQAGPARPAARVRRRRRAALGLRHGGGRAVADTRVIGVEPEAGDDTRQSLAQGERVRIPVPRTIADGQQLPIPGELTFPVVQRLVSGIAVASDPEIVRRCGSCSSA
jgi:threonine dehydratase